MLVRTVDWIHCIQFDLKYEIHDIKYCCIQYFVNKKKIIQSTKYWKNTRCSDYQFDLSYKTQDGGLDGVAFHGYWYLHRYTPFLFCLLFGLNAEPNLSEYNITSPIPTYFFLFKVSNNVYKPNKLLFLFNVSLHSVDGLLPLLLFIDFSQLH